jgi:hypothetical protein
LEMVRTGRVAMARGLKPTPRLGVPRGAPTTDIGGDVGNCSV